MPNYGIINDRSPHLIADLCEIISFHERTPVARGDIESFINAKGGAGLLQDLQGNGDTETNDRIQRLTEDAFQHLLYRAKAFGDWYPFLANHDVLELKETLDDRHKVYATLLIDSRLKMLEGGERIRHAAEFEKICHLALPALLPAWNNYHFGVGGADRHQFGNSLRKALPALAEKLRDDVHLPRINELSPQDTGDAGIDLVSIYEWADNAQGLPAYFGQCAAQQVNWPEKKFEAHPLTHERFISFFHKPGTILFIPVCYHGPDGKWIDSQAFQTVLIDRLRLIELFQARIDNGSLTTYDILSPLAVMPDPGAFVFDTLSQDAA